MKKILLSLSILIISVSLFAQEKMPKIQREFRAMWLTTVTNSDFPSAQGMTAEQQKAELIKYVELAQELRMNTIIFQVRPMGDAVYQSEIEPSSYFLTGEMGKKLEFDPLKMLIDEAHARGILVHAWFNPYRASHSAVKGEYAANHITKTRPDLVRTYNKFQMLDPGEKDSQAHVTKVIMDVVKRYDVDGIHFDDYFYPYLDANRTDFPDEESWKKYKDAGGKLSRADWRRKNVDDLIENVAAEIKKEKPFVMFGISPFGIWKPDDVNIKGTSAYDTLYADSKKWLQEGWVDYLAPQLYWSTTKEGQRFPILLDWWKRENKKKRHLWVGVATYKIGDSTYPDFSLKELLLQIDTTRAQLDENAGAIHFRARMILENKGGLRDYLRDTVYNKNAIIPLSPWITVAKPTAPQIEITTDPATKNLRVSWKNSDKEQAFRWIFYWQDKNGWKTTVLPQTQNNADVPANLGIQKFAVAAVDRLGNVSETSIKNVN